MLLNLKKKILLAINISKWNPSIMSWTSDLKDGFFSVPLASTHQHCLFDDFFQSTCMPNGYGPAMRAFANISIVLFGRLRSLSHHSVVYVGECALVECGCIFSQFEQ